MKKTLIAYALSDLHLHLWAKFNKYNARTLKQFRVLSYLFEQSLKTGKPILFCGDFFHKSESIDTDLLEIIEQAMPLPPSNQVKVIAISGNHDLKKINTIDNPQYSLVQYLSHRYSWFNCIDLKDYQLDEDTIVHGVPYIDHNVGVSEYLNKLDLEKGKKHILLLHTDYQGASDTDGRIIDSVENLNLNVINKFDLVLCGHIHKPQRLSKKVYMVGAPNQQRRTDKNCKLGYWEIYSDLSVEFKELKGFPKFIDVESSDDVKDDGNYYTVVPAKVKEKPETTHKITKQLSKKRIAKKYLREKQISDKNKKELLIKILTKTESC